MELDVVNVCWDALDGATFFQLLVSFLFYFTHSPNYT